MPAFDFLTRLVQGAWGGAPGSDAGKVAPTNRPPPMPSPDGGAGGAGGGTSAHEAASPGPSAELFNHQAEAAGPGVNAERAQAAEAQLEKLAATSPEARQRLSPEIVDMLVEGVATPRTDSDRGQAGILGARQARDSAQSLIDMTPEEVAHTQELLDQAGNDSDGKPKAGADKAAEQALILKAIAARRETFGDADGFMEKVQHFLGVETRRERAAREVEAFAVAIRGMSRDELIQSTTLIDVDDRNTSTLDPEETGGADTQADNDGLFQRFTMSCGPTTAQMVKGEVDPVYALQLRKEKFYDPDPNSDFAREQKQVLERHGGVAVVRSGAEARKDADEKVAELRKNHELSDEQHVAIGELLGGTPLEGEKQKQAQEALDALRAKADGHPTDAEIAAMHADKGKVGAGTSLPSVLNSVAGSSAHLDYASKGLGLLGLGGEMTPDKLENVDGLLEDGQQVPIRIAGAGNDGHFMMVSDVRRGPTGERRYLVSDPMSGATRWVAEADFKSGDFTTKVFDLGKAAVTGFYADEDQRI